MLLYLLILIVLSYFIFVFISDLFNPFVIVKAPLRRRRWRLGRAAALASLVAGAIALLLLELEVFNLRSAVAGYVVLTSLFVIPSVVKHKKTAIWQ